MPDDGFIEITSAQRDSLAFRPYRAFFGWQYSSADHDFRGDGKVYRPGHRLPNGNWIVPRSALVEEPAR